tara:strand:+ start:19 stop:267 length:249 start_codon:yes stop_codon:yes gene_type:complete
MTHEEKARELVEKFKGCPSNYIDYPEQIDTISIHHALIAVDRTISLLMALFDTALNELEQAPISVLLNQEMGVREEIVKLKS